MLTLLLTVIKMMLMLLFVELAAVGLLLLIVVALLVSLLSTDFSVSAAYTCLSSSDGKVRMGHLRRAQTLGCRLLMASALSTHYIVPVNYCQCVPWYSWWVTNLHAK